MTVQRDPDRLIHAFLMEGATELADEVYVTVRDRIEETRQRAVIGSWREPDVNRYLKIALAAAAVLVVAVVGFRQFNTTDDASSASSGSPAPTATQASTSPASLTEAFTSERNGITFSYPSGWVPRPATEPWTTGLPDFGQNTGDVVYDSVREGNLWIVAASQPIGDATPDEWAAERLTVDALGLEEGCTATEPITVDGATGLIGVEGCNAAAVTADGRGYFILLYASPDEPSLATTYDKAWFEDFLATVQLQP